MNNFIQILTDNIQSWIIPYSNELNQKLIEFGYQVENIENESQIKESDFLFILGCEKIIKKENYSKSKMPVVIHESDLPKGKGWSPLTWQILEGKNIIPICMILASEEVDSGDILLRDEMIFSGNELNTELKKIQGIKTIEMCLKLVRDYKNIKPIKQTGESTFYKKRKPEHSKLDISKSIAENFNLLRVCDNERYPAYFELNGRKYKLKIEIYE